MEADRTLRFLIPPCFLVGFVLLGAHLDERTSLANQLSQLTESYGVGQVLAAGGVVLISTGFLIGVVNVLIQKFLSLLASRLFFRRRGHSKYYWSFEAAIDDRSFLRIRRYFGLAGNARYPDKQFAEPMYVRLVLPQEPLAWVERRWNVFATSTNCIVALLGALVLGPAAIDFHYTWGWLSATLIVLMLLTAHAWVARREMVRNLRFITRSQRLRNHLEKRSINHAGDSGTELVTLDMSEEVLS